MHRHIQHERGHFKRGAANKNIKRYISYLNYMSNARRPLEYATHAGQMFSTGCHGANDIGRVYPTFIYQNDNEKGDND